MVSPERTEALQMGRELGCLRKDFDLSEFLLILWPKHGQDFKRPEKE